MSDHSLDEFARDSESDDGEDDPKTDDSEPTDGDEPASTTVDPAVATAAVSPDGAPCEACGTAVPRRWHDDGQYVCPDCKEW
ncbi:DUF7573 domain-containing protein [Halovenus sp. HT40]|uniref:DUF7573 domain-containing protein n=1 Tax=Halovenus sp. HT40 TaxID=3126691 RepID=UPI00300EA087